ncbi:hypothetical protein ACFYO9_19025 [Streptomyces sp. NPDC005863]|uniref:hypothetical protein n=1 Tax=unclassified Streptomyces TaxID=2593676 RepID=UPI0033FB0241
MSEQVPASPGADGSTPVPRDPPDQQADGGQDPWEVQEGDQSEQGAQGKERGAGGAGGDVPETDEAGTGRRGQEDADGDGAPKEQTPQEPSG